jgi:hypothetical protein
MFRKLGVATAAVMLSACALTPDYERPELDVPADYVEADGGTCSRTNNSSC